MTIADVFVILGRVRDDYSADYSMEDARSDVCCILMQPIIDSGYKHPLFQSLLTDICDAAYQVTGDEHCLLEESRRQRLTISLNQLMRNEVRRGPKACYAEMFNNIIIPSLVLLRRRD